MTDSRAQIDFSAETAGAGVVARLRCRQRLTRRLVQPTTGAVFNEHIEGVSWISATRVMAISDRCKKNQPEEGWSEKDQSVRIFDIPSFGRPSNPGGQFHVSDHQNKQRSESDAELEREIRRQRKFTLQEALGRMAGPGAMKGESPITRLQQAESEIALWLRSHLKGAGELELVLQRDIKESELLLKHLDQLPLVVLARHCQRVLDSDYLLQELVRNADVEWGRTMGERPHFEKEGAPADPEDPYTVESVRNTLLELLKELNAHV